MCDTQLIRSDGRTLFAKNSDREPGEPQRIIRTAPVENDVRPFVQTTYLRIPQTANRHGVILSQPSWIWGAEMGVNDHGLVIGNEAVFTRLTRKSGQALLGMDLVRLGLERGSCADEALSIITRLLDTYGQGGAAGYLNKGMRYDNSFIIADHRKAWKLETAGEWWIARKINRFDAISNSLSIGQAYDLAKPGLEDFARRNGYLGRFQNFSFARAFDTRLIPWLGAARQRRQLSLKCLHNSEPSLAAMVSNLRRHHRDHKHFRRHSNRDICMHAAGHLRPSQTCASMAAEVYPDQAPKVLMTGTSAPCLSLFKPVDFNFDRKLKCEYIPARDRDQCLWQRFEPVHRKALMHAEFRDQLTDSRDRAEAYIMAHQDQVAGSDQDAIAWHLDCEQRARKWPVSTTNWRPYERFWSRV